MAFKKPSKVPFDVIAKARQEAAASRQNIESAKAAGTFLTQQERDDAAPFYFVLREYIRQLKEIRESAGLTLAQVAQKSGLAIESLSRLETGAQTNPTWKTLGVYAIAVGHCPRLVPEKAQVRPTATIVRYVEDDTVENGQTFNAYSQSPGQRRLVAAVG